MSAVCLLFRQLFVYFCQQLFVYNLNFPAKNLGFPSVFCQNNASKLELSVSCLFTFSAVCLHFHQLFVYFFVSYLFTIWIFAPKTLVSHQSFVKIMLQSLFTFSAVCLHFQLFVYLLFRQLIVYFCQLFVYNLNFHAKIMFFPSVFCQNNASKFVYIFSYLFTFSAVCLLFCQLIVYFLSADCLQFEFSRQNHVFSISLLSK